MENDLLNAVIETVVISPLDYGVRFEAQDKKVYNVPKTLKEGGLTKAWEQLENMKFKPRDPITGESGTVVAIGYVEVPNKHGGTSRYIRNFRETNELPTSQPEVRQEVRKPDSVANFAPQGKPHTGQGEEFWDKKAYKQCLWNYWLKTGRYEPDIVWAIFNDIERDADDKYSKPRTETFRPSMANDESGQRIERVAPDIQERADEMEAEQVEQITGEDIPF